MKTVTTFPCFVNRWFSSGNGYAHDSRITDRVLIKCLDAMPKGQLGRQLGEFSWPLPDGGWVIAERETDLNCLDPRAIERSPTILRAVVLPRQPGSRLQKWFHDQLRQLPLPTRPDGNCDGLAVVAPIPLELPKPRSLPGLCLMQLAPWLIAGGTLPIVVGCFAATGNLLTVPLSAMLVVVFAIAKLVSSLQPKPPSAAQLIECEEALLDGCSDLFADNGTVVLPDSLGWCNSLGKCPTILDRPTYDQVLVSSGLAILYGGEKIQGEADRPIHCRFVRVYIRQGRRWRIVMVQWTSMEQTGEKGAGVVGVFETVKMGLVEEKVP